MAPDFQSAPLGDTSSLTDRSRSEGEKDLNRSVNIQEMLQRLHGPMLDENARKGFDKRIWPIQFRIVALPTIDEIKTECCIIL